MISLHGSFRKAAYAGIVYSSFGLIFLTLNLTGILSSLVFFTLTNLLFMIFIHVFIQYVELYPSREQDRRNQRNSHAILFLKYFVFITVISCIVLLSTITIHEFGHATISKFYDCEFKTIFFEGNKIAYTQIICPNSESRFPAIFGGILIPIFIALILFLVGGNLSRAISILIVGFGLLISSRDLTDLDYSQSIAFSITYIGFISVIIGVVLLARLRFDEYFK